MLAYYLSDLATLLQNKKENDGWEVSTISLMHVSNAILCCRGSRQRSTASCPFKKPFRWSLIRTYRSSLVLTSSVSYRHLVVIACSALCLGLSVYFLRLGITPSHSVGKKVPSPHGSQPFLQRQANPCLPSWATWSPR
jgi:hypothetical protein